MTDRAAPSPGEPSVPAGPSHPDGLAAARADDAAPVRGLWFDEFELGAVFETASRVVTQTDVETFAELTGDRNPLHLDEAFARRSRFRTRVAHGLLIEALASGLAWECGIFDGTIAALARVDRRFVAPVSAGDAIRLRLEVVELDPAPKPRRGRVGFAATALNQRDQVVIEGGWEAIMARKQ